MESLEGKMTRRSSLERVSTKLQRIAELARQAPTMVFTTLAHVIDVEFLKEAYRRTRKDGATGVDGETAEQYQENLEENLQDLENRLKAGTYRAPPVRRVHIPKGDGRRTRPIGIPTFEDKVLQRAVTMVLEAVYEQDFCECSYGFRPGRSAHQALDELWHGLMRMGGGWVLELDIQNFFDAMGHHHLRSFLDQRVRDGVIRRTIDKWLKAGVMEDEQLVRKEVGSPQGGVVSPILANIYLHHVLDEWFKGSVKPHIFEQAFMVRYADDAVLVFRLRQDAERVMNVLPKRFEKYGLTLHPEKTRLTPFHRPPPGQGGGGRWDKSRQGTFAMLGFTHYWGRSRRGRWVVKRKTSSSRFSRAVKRVAEWCRCHRHMAVREQHQMLIRKLRGHYQYYGITGNGPALQRFLYEVSRSWRKWLDRRSHKSHMAWDRFERLLQRHPLPSPVVVHSVYSRAANP